MKRISLFAFLSIAAAACTAVVSDVTDLEFPAEGSDTDTDTDTDADTDTDTDTDTDADTDTGSDTTGELYGVVLLAGVSNNAGVTITVNGGASAVSSSSGEWSIDGLVAGNYDVTASKTGYEDAQVTAVQLPAGGSVQVDEMVLEELSCELNSGWPCECDVGVNNACDNGDVCVQAISSTTAGTFCATECSSDPCEDTDYSATSYCGFDDTSTSSSYCVLQCDDASDCPPGQDCIAFDTYSICHP